MSFYSQESLLAVKDYRSALTQFSGNDLNQIRLLTILAEDYAVYASEIVRVVQEEITQTNKDAKVKLAYLYVLDSIIKNVRDASIRNKYRLEIARVIVQAFIEVFNEADVKVREALYKVRLNWKGIFPQSLLRNLDLEVKAIDKKWPLVEEVQHKVYAPVAAVQPIIKVESSRLEDKSFRVNMFVAAQTKPILKKHSSLIDPRMAKGTNVYSSQEKKSLSSDKSSFDAFVVSKVLNKSVSFKTPNTPAENKPYQKNYEAQKPFSTLQKEKSRYSARNYGYSRHHPYQKRNAPVGKPIRSSQSHVTKVPTLLTASQKPTVALGAHAFVAPPLQALSASLSLPTSIASSVTHQQVPAFKQDPEDAMYQSTVPGISIQQKPIEVQPKVEPKATIPDFKELFSKLQKSGLLEKLTVLKPEEPSTSKKVSLGPSDFVRSVSLKYCLDIIDRKAAPEASMKNLKNMDASFFHHRYDSAIQALHQEKTHCRFCNIEFREKGESYRLHIDAHLQEWKKTNNQGYAIKSRSWYMGENDWIDHSEIEQVNNLANKEALEEEKVQIAAKDEVVADEVAFRVCSVCNEAFEQFWDDDDDNWKLRDCVIQNGGAYHRACLSDADFIDRSTFVGDEEPMESDDESIKPELAMDFLKTVMQKVTRV